MKDQPAVHGRQQEGKVFLGHYQHVERGVQQGVNREWKGEIHTMGVQMMAKNKYKTKSEGEKKRSVGERNMMYNLAKTRELEAQ